MPGNPAGGQMGTKQGRGGKLAEEKNSGYLNNIVGFRSQSELSQRGIWADNIQVGATGSPALKDPISTPRSESQAWSGISC